jgi:HAE1 family hydrophobic/amphiphilic exporter-1
LKGEPAINTTVSISGLNPSNFSNGSSYAAGFINLKPVDQRGHLSDINDLATHFSEKLEPIKDADLFMGTFPTLPGFGNFNGLDFVLQDHTGGDYATFAAVADSFIAVLNKEKTLEEAHKNFKADFPQLDLEVDYGKAKQLGVNIKDLMTTMQAYFGSVQVTDLNRFGKYYRVYMQADIPYRTEPAVLEDIFVKNQSGQMVPISSIASLKHVYGPESIDRYNLFNSITINATPARGVSTGTAMQAVESAAAKKLPLGYSYEWENLSREEKISGGQMFSIFMLSLVFVYLILSALYESYILPLAVMLSIPTGIIGVFLALRLTGNDNNIYVQVGLIMLIGLLAKNAILIVEFALQKRKAGHTLFAAAVEGASLRLRPILMTSFAFIAGLIPLMYAKGASANGNHSISIGTAGGMLTGVLLGIFVVPVLFMVFQSLQEKVSLRRKPIAEPA